ncbi:hypothetical protein B2K_40160 [Paenibacillus mucilaginosus K02]|uniref:Uncharacterized protein n=1 Tax=Paenibacillus mucilaginosus K02 TaxID=997761 RepID=R9ULR5_9BACL|nr:hypothetical protein B2K_40160 [Paenibacillus mucilaginosus K02]
MPGPEAQVGLLGVPSGRMHAVHFRRLNSGGSGSEGEGGSESEGASESKSMCES